LRATLNECIRWLHRQPRHDGQGQRARLSSFKRWAGTETTFDKDAIEIALARTIGDTVEGAYWRNDPMIKKRRARMQACSDYVRGRARDADNVVKMPVKAAQ
jgi:hypothetical protein